MNVQFKIPKEAERVHLLCKKLIDSDSVRNHAALPFSLINLAVNAFILYALLFTAPGDRLRPTMTERHLIRKIRCPRLYIRYID
jgi:hypothetical protein